MLPQQRVPFERSTRKISSSFCGCLLISRLLSSLGVARCSFLSNNLLLFLDLPGHLVLVRFEQFLSRHLPFL